MTFKANLKIKVTGNSISNVLSSYLEESKKRNPSFSLRALARKVNISPGALSRVLNEKRNLSKEQSIKIMDTLNIDDITKNRVLKEYDLTSSLEYEECEEVDIEYFDPSEVWKVMAILNLVKMKNFIISSKSIAKRLNILEEEVQVILKKLLSNKLLATDEQGSFYRTKARIITSDDIPSDYVKELHYKNLELASEALNNISVEYRDITSMTFNMSSENIKEVKKVIRKFYTELSAITEYDGDEVYHINMQLFPLTSKGRH